jgi:hypothetical protein
MRPRQIKIVDSRIKIEADATEADQNRGRSQYLPPLEIAAIGAADATEADQNRRFQDQCFGDDWGAIGTEETLLVNSIRLAVGGFDARWRTPNRGSAKVVCRDAAD